MQLSPDKLAEVFAELETDRAEEYQRARRQQLFEFATAATQCTKGEDPRSATFRQIVQETQDAFEKKESQRNKEFLKVVDRQDVLSFRSNDEAGLPSMAKELTSSSSYFYLTPCSSVLHTSFTTIHLFSSDSHFPSELSYP